MASAALPPPQEQSIVVTVAFAEKFHLSPLTPNVLKGRSTVEHGIITEITGLMMDSSDCIYIFWSKRSMHFWSLKAEVGGGGLQVNSQFPTA